MQMGEWHLVGLHMAPIELCYSDEKNNKNDQLLHESLLKKKAEVMWK